MSSAVAVAGDLAAPAVKKGGRKKLILMAVPVLLILVGAGLWFTGILPGLLGMKTESAEHAGAHGGKEAAASKAGPVFVELPEMVANLNTGRNRASFVKLKARLELAKAEDTEALKAAQPRILDLFQTYLREMRPDELRGSAGTYRLREELIARASLAVAPARVIDVLFTELLVQ